MDLTQIFPQPTQAQTPPSEAPTNVSSLPRAAEYAHCDECNAAVDHDQRYCVNCGAHRRHVNDPAARYLSQATARARSTTVTTGARPAAARRLPSLALALLLAVIPVAVAIGVTVGRSSNNDDAQLIRELSRSQAQLAATRASDATTAGATTSSTAGTSTGSRGKSAKHSSSTRARHSAKPASTATKAAGNLNSAPSTSQQNQGSKIVTQLQHTNGTSYLNQLPSQVVVP